MDLVVGASGFIGNALWNAHRPKACIGTYCTYPLLNLCQLDITDGDAVQGLIDKIRPKTIYHPAALPNVDWCETNRSACWDVNVNGTKNLVAAARRAKSKLVFFSTDYIFDGREGPYGETDEPNPINVYGESKLAAERIISESLDDYLIVRVTVVYGIEKKGKNFIAHLLRSLKENQPVMAPKDQRGTPTYVENLVDSILALVELDQRGTFNVTGGQLLDRYEFAVLAAKIFGFDSHLVQPVTTAELGQTARRPLNAGLKIDKALSALGPVFSDPEMGLSILKQRLFP